MAFLETETKLRLPREKWAGGLEVCWIVELGRRSYQEAMALQAQAVACRKLHRIPDCLLLVEHPHTITLGRTGDLSHLLVPEADLQQMGVEFHATDRGGDITYHGPGQLVAYPVLDLKGQRRDIGHYLRRLEQTVIDTIETFGIKSQRVAGATGVWVGDRKIAAIGVRTSQWVTSHGLALNANTDLNYFQLIIPCGIRCRGVTSMWEVLGNQVDISLLKHRYCENFGRIFLRRFQVHPQAEVFSGDAA